MERASSTDRNFFMIIGRLRAHGMSPTTLRPRGSISPLAMRHMYWVCYCKSQSCGQFRLVHYIGLTSQTIFVQPDGWWGLPMSPLRETDNRYVGSDLAPIAGHA